MKYVRLVKTLNDRGILIPLDKIQENIKNPEIDHYVSTYLYSEDHYKKFQETHSVAGFENLTTNKIWWDFDSEKLSNAKKDTLILISRLKDQNIDPDNLEIFFSGNKGFHVILNVKQELNKNQVVTIAKKFAGDLKTFDPVVYNENRYLRLEGTKHQKTGLYKIPISYYELQNLNGRSYLEECAKNPHYHEKPYFNFDLPNHLLDINKEPKKEESKPITDFDLSTKPRGWKASKWALAQGFIKPGERDQAMMVLASTYKAMGYTVDQNYYLCKSALKQSWSKYGQGGFTKEELYEKILRIYGPDWKGGTYSEKDDLFLQKKSEELGIKELTSTSTIDIKGALTLFKGYAKNIDELTLKTGIEELDQKQRITVGMSWGIIAAAGSGKTSLALQILHAMSKAGELSVFFSFDMFGPHLIQKVIQKHWGKNDDINTVFEKYQKGDQEYVKKVEDLLISEYPNVEFCFDSGLSTDDIRNVIRDAEQKRNKKCRFIVVDYNELVVADVNDPFQATNQTAQKMRALAANDQICVLSLFQPNKASGDPSIEIKSYLNAKGGQTIGASVSFMLGVSRPGYDPRNPSQDKFMSLNVVKNRMGPIFYVDLHWDGYKGEVRKLNPTEVKELKDLRYQKEHGDDENQEEKW